MAIGALQQQLQVIRDAAALALDNLDEAVEDFITEFETVDEITDNGKFLLTLIGKDWKSIARRIFEDGKEFKPYPISPYYRDADAIANWGISDVTGENNRIYNDGKAAWNSVEMEVARTENEQAKAEGKFVELRKARLNAYRGGFRYPPTEENGWKTWEIRELDADHVASLGY